MSVEVSGVSEGQPIPTEYAFCVAAATGHVTMAPNQNPTVSWTGAPPHTRSFALLCIDKDAPTEGTNVNREGVTVSADLARTDFSHWVLVDIGSETTTIGAGADSDGVTPHGKPCGATEIGVRGANDYTSWFADDADMVGVYGGYDGPCPPWNDELVHRYCFTVYALDVESLGMSGDFTAGDVTKAMAGHVLDQASVTGTYTLNPDRGATFS